MNVTRSLLDDIKTKQLKWYGHVQRMEEGRLPKKVMKWSPPEIRKRGRPKLTWTEEIRVQGGVSFRQKDDCNVAKMMVFIAEQNKSYMFRPISAIIRFSQLLC